MSPYLAIFGVTLRQLTGKKRVIGFGLLSLVPAGLLLLFTQLEESWDVAELEEALSVFLMAPFLAILIPVITLVIAGSALGDEQDDKTLSFLVLRPLSRAGIAAAKTAAAIAAASIFGLIGGAGMIVIFLIAGGGAGVIPAVFTGIVVACAVYGALFVLLGYAVPKATLVGLIYIFLIEGALVSALPRLATLSPWRIGLAAVVDLLPEGFAGGDNDLRQALGNLDPALGSMLLKTAVIAAVSIGAVTFLLRRNDAV